MGFSVLVENGRALGEVVADAVQMGVGEGDLDGEVALRCADVGERFVVGPRDLLRDGDVGSAADGGHGREEVFEARGIGVQRGKGRFS